jgi:PPM family protein phosphatase
MRVSWAAATHAGRRRASNEDSYCARPDLGLFVVADGMGGHVAGEVASRLAVDAIEATVEARETSAGDVRPLSTAEQRLHAAYQHASRTIASETSQQPRLRGMATTASAVLVTAEGCAIGHVGDSRIYLWRDGVLQQLTRDHSWVAEQVHLGVLTEEDARQHPWRNVVTRALSAGDVPAVDFAPFHARQGDRLLLSSDGLHGVVPDETIGEMLGGPGSLDELCQRLIDAANAAGGPDNITTLILHVDVP